MRERWKGRREREIEGDEGVTRRKRRRSERTYPLDVLMNI